MRKLVCAAIALVICASAGLLAQDKKEDGKKPEPKRVSLKAGAKIEKVDADKGVITLSINKAKGKEVEVLETTRFIIQTTGEEPKELKGKDGLKDEHFKEGTAVLIELDKDDKLVEVKVFLPPQKKPKPPVEEKKSDEKKPDGK